MKRMILLILVCSLPVTVFAQTNLEEYFNLCLEFGAPREIVELFQSFRTYKGENNGSISYVVREENSLLKDKPYSEYQIWYTIDKEQGLYQSTLIIRGDKPVLQNILTSYLKKFSALNGEPVYTNLENGSLLVFWYNDATFTVKTRLILDTVNAYKFVSITFCSPQTKHTKLLRTLYNGTSEEENEPLSEPVKPPASSTPPAVSTPPASSTSPASPVPPAASALPDEKPETTEDKETDHSEPD